NVPYAEVVIAAFLPALLYYAALMLQTDAFAARNKLVGLDRSEVPPIGGTLKPGWPYIGAPAPLTYPLLASPVAAAAALLLSLFLLFVAVLRARSTGFNLRGFCQLTVDVGQGLAQLVCLIAGIGLIIGALSITGVANSFSRELVQYAGGNVYLLLAAGALTSF